jgi:hypothetical protein
MSTTSPRKTVDMLRSFDEEETTNQEQIVLRPDQVKKIHIHCPEYQDLPIIPDAFRSNSECFPMSQTWTRPKRLRYPVEAEVTMELLVKNVRCATKPHRVTLKGTNSIFNNCCITQ